MATAASAKDIKDFVFEWEGKDRSGKIVRGEIRAVGENQVQATLRRQGVFPTKIKKRRMRSGKKIKPKDIALFTRQLATMMKAGVPLLQAFDIVGRGNTMPASPSCLTIFAPISRQGHRSMRPLESIQCTLIASTATW